MTTQTDQEADQLLPGDPIEMPRPTVWPLVLSLGVTLAVTGLITNTFFSAIGVVLFIIGLTGWMKELLPAPERDELSAPVGVHWEEREPAQRQPQVIAAHPGSVEELRPGMAGYRFRLPEKVHPISAGVLGGVVGGLVMPIPALFYGLISQHSIWFPINLLAGMALPMDDTTLDQLRAFNLSNLIVGLCIHTMMSLILGLMYGVLMPALPDVPPGKAIWGGVLLPVLWTGATHGLMGVVNPLMQEYVDWRYFLLSQLVFGIAASVVVLRSQEVPIEPLKGGEAPTGEQAGREA